MEPSNAEKFKELAVKRTSSAILEIRKLKTLASKKRYDFDKGQIDQILAALRDEVKEVEAVFTAALAGKPVSVSGDAFSFAPAKAGK